MRITKVEIRNFRSHIHTVVDLTKHHALVGLNGSGKTSVLDAISIATSARPRAVSEHDFNNLDQGTIMIRVWFDAYFINKVPDGFQSQYLPCQSMYCYIKRREAASPGRLLSDPFVVSLTCEPVVYDNVGYLDADLLPEGIEVNKLPRAVHTAEGGFRITRRSGNVLSARFDLINLQNDTVGYPNVFYFDRSRERQTKTGFNTTLSRITKELNWRYRKGADKPPEPDDDGNVPTPILDLWNAYYEQVLEFVGKDRRKQLIDDVRKRVAQLSGIAFDDLEMSLLDIEQPFGKGFFARRDGTNQIDASELGSGMSMLFAYCLLQHISEQSRADVIFLFDEPELHLHPELQKRLAKSITGATHQVIYTTHSPLFVDLGNWRSITRFDADCSTHPTADTLTAEVAGSTMEQHLQDIKRFRQHESIFFDADSEVFFAQKVLLVEGPADKYGIPRLASLLGKDLTALTIVCCNGKQKVKNYAVLCQAFCVDAFVVFDLDGKPGTANENKAVLGALGELPRRAYKTSFEELLGISKKADQKAFKVLEKIDTIAKDDIPAEIARNIRAIATWYEAKE